MQAPSGNPAPFTVTVEALSWVNRFLGGAGSGSLELTERVTPGETLRDLLRRLSERYPQLREALWDRASDELGGHIELVVNEAILGIARGLDDPLAPGDRITLLGQYIGG